MPATTLSLRAAVLLLLGFWAAAWLAGLGGMEIRGEEGRRLLPAVEMLKSGDWLVPRIGGEVYLRKPPLINWLAALSFKLGGAQNEWLGRLPSALATLGLGLGILLWCRRPLGLGAALLAAVFAMGNVSLLEKGRLAEIEAIYIVCCGLAFAWWSAAWWRGCSDWAAWLPAGLLLGLGMLAKGPVHLLFFYLPVMGTLWQAGRAEIQDGGLRALLRPAPLAGLALCAGVFALWAVPMLQATGAGETGSLWARQLTDRVAGEGDAAGAFSPGKWLAQFPRTLVNFLPWTLLLPLLWRPGPPAHWSARQRAWFLGCRTGMILAAVLVLLVPGSSSRFVMPLVAVPALLLGAVMGDPKFALSARLDAVWRGVLLALATAGALAAVITPWAGGFSGLAWAGGGSALILCAGIWARRSRLRGVLNLTAASTAVMAALMLIYAGAVLRLVRERGEDLPMGELVNRALPAGELLVAFDTGFEPFLFYLREPLVYATRLAELPATGHWLLCEKTKLERLTPTRRLAGEAAAVEFADRDGKPMVVMKMLPKRP